MRKNCVSEVNGRPTNRRKYVRAGRGIIAAVAHFADGLGPKVLLRPVRSVMGDVKVIEGQLSSVAADLRGIVERTSAELTDLDGELTALLGSGWIGQAGAAFAGVWHDWDEGAANLIRGLDTMAGLLDSAAQVYHQTDDEGAAAMDSAGM
jgi:WXG100 family type VII secretion target